MNVVPPWHDLHVWSCQAWLKGRKCISRPAFGGSIHLNTTSSLRLSGPRTSKNHLVVQQSFFVPKACQACLTLKTWSHDVTRKHKISEAWRPRKVVPCQYKCRYKYTITHLPPRRHRHRHGVKLDPGAAQRETLRQLEP